MPPMPPPTTMPPGAPPPAAADRDLRGVEGDVVVEAHRGPPSPGAWTARRAAAPRLDADRPSPCLAHRPVVRGRPPTERPSVITAAAVELRAGSRLLLDDATFRVAPGDRVGLVGRNGAGKTTLTKALAGRGPARRRHDHPQRRGRLPAAGPAHRRPRRHRPRPGPVRARARHDRARPARRRGARWRPRPARSRSGRCAATAGSRTSSRPRAATPPSPRPRRSPPALGLAERVLGQTARHPVRRPAPPHRAGPHPVLRAPRPCCSTSRPTTSTPTRSPGCATTSRATRAASSSSRHDVELLDAVVNKVFHLDANRGELDQYNLGWKAYLQQRETDERRRKRERANAEKKAAALMAQADKMRAKATKTVAAQNMARRAERLLAGLEDERAARQGRQAALPRSPSPCGKTPLRGERAVAAPTARWRSSPTSTSRSTAAPGSSSSASTAPARRRCCGCSPASSSPTPAQVEPGHGLRLGYYAQEHETLDVDRTVLENMRSAAPDLGDTEVRKVLGSFLFSGDDVDKPAGVLSGGEKTRLALAPLVVSGGQRAAARRAHEQPRPGLAARRSSAPCAPTRARSCSSPTTRARSTRSSPSAILLLPDGVEDLFSADYRDLVTLA